MPFSSASGKVEIRKLVESVPHAKMLDIGPGCGTYARMFPDAEWTGVEIWEPYVETYGLRDVYKNLIIADARTWVPTERYDVAIAGDVLEHMTPEEAKDLLAKLRCCATMVIVSIPIGHYPQSAYNGNPYEEHIKDDWTDEEMRAFNPSFGTVVEGIGVYAWERLKIAVYTVALNEEQFVQRFCESAKDADLILIADTGSEDNTVAKAIECGAQVHDICITPWRFDHARNTALALVPRGYDVCISLDLDEVLEPGWREEIERVWTPETTRLGYYFDWGMGIRFRYEKIHARHGYHWHHPVHEYPTPDRITEVWAETTALLVRHLPDSSKSRGSYLPLLELSVKEDPQCPRNAFYYARELSFYGRWEEGIEACKRYLALPGAIWANERCYAYRVMGKCYSELGNQWEAEKAFHLAAAEAPNTREPWCELATLMYRQSRWPECYAAAMRAIGIKDRALVYTCDPAVWGHWAHDYASIAAWHMGLTDVAIEQARIAVELSPDDPRLRNNLALVEGRHVIAA